MRFLLLLLPLLGGCASAPPQPQKPSVTESEFNKSLDCQSNWSFAKPSNDGKWQLFYSAGSYPKANLIHEGKPQKKNGEFLYEGNSTESHKEFPNESYKINLKVAVSVDKNKPIPFSVYQRALVSDNKGKVVADFNSSTFYQDLTNIEIRMGQNLEHATFEKSYDELTKAEKSKLKSGLHAVYVICSFK